MTDLELKKEVRKQRAAEGKVMKKGAGEADAGEA